MASTAVQKSSNPAFNAGLMKSLSRQPHEAGVSRAADTVTIGGAALKSLVLLVILMASATAVIAYFLPTMLDTKAIPVELIVCLLVGALGGFVMAMYTIFVPSHRSPILLTHVLRASG